MAGARRHGVLSAGSLLGMVGSVLMLAGCAASAAPFPGADARQVARGREVYRGACASCHGPRAEGAPNWQQPDFRGNLPPPPHDDSGHTWRHPDRQLGEIIRGGLRDPFNKTPELTMPPFGDLLDDEEIGVVIAYLKSLWSLEHRTYQEEQNQRPDVPMAEPAR